MLGKQPAGVREQALGCHPVAPDDGAEGGDQPQPAGRDAAHEVPQAGRLGGSVRTELSLGQLRDQPRLAGPGRVPDRRDRAELALDARHRGSQLGRICYVDDLVGDPGARRAQPLKPVRHRAVLAGAVAADDGDRRAAAGKYLGQRQPGAPRAAADQDDIRGPEREGAASRQQRGLHDRLERLAGPVDRQLAELAGRRGGMLARGPEPVGALRHPQQRDAQRWMLGVQAGPEAGEAGPVADHDEPAGADRVPCRRQRDRAGVRIISAADDGKGAARAGLVREKLVDFPFERMVRGNRDPPGPVIPGADRAARWAQLLGIAAGPRPDPGDRLVVRDGIDAGRGRAGRGCLRLARGCPRLGRGCLRLVRDSLVPGCLRLVQDCLRLVRGCLVRGCLARGSLVRDRGHRGREESGAGQRPGVSRRGSAQRVRQPRG